MITDNLGVPSGCLHILFPFPPTKRNHYNEVSGFISISFSYVKRKKKPTHTHTWDEQVQHVAYFFWYLAFIKTASSYLWSFLYHLTLLLLRFIHIIECNSFLWNIFCVLKIPLLICILLLIDIWVVKGFVCVCVCCSYEHNWHEYSSSCLLIHAQKYLLWSRKYQIINYANIWLFNKMSILFLKWSVSISTPIRGPYKFMKVVVAAYSYPHWTVVGFLFFCFHFSYSCGGVVVWCWALVFLSWLVKLSTYSYVY